MNQTNFDPNGVGLRNGHFIGLPFTESSANIVLLSIPWDVTTSYNPGTAVGPANILEASTQLDLADFDHEEAWNKGIYLRPSDINWWGLNNQLRQKARRYINYLEDGGILNESRVMQECLEEINQAGEHLNQWVHKETSQLLDSGKMVGIVGGEHSVPLGFLKALADRHNQFSVLQIDAHMDLRPAYEGFKYSHASIIYNTLDIGHIDYIVQVGIRDWCEAEAQLVKKNDRIRVFYDQQIREGQFRGETFHDLCQEIIEPLSKKVYISFDIDGLDPQLCPNTGTPVPGGLQYREAIYMVKQIVESGREIIGFDLCEVAGVGEWDGNVGARLLYDLSNWMSASKAI